MSKEKNSQPASDTSEPSGNGQVEQMTEQAALLARAEAAEKKSEEFLDLAKRTKADFENYQKRFARDLAEERRYALRPLAADLLPLIDNLERALAAAKEAGESGPLRKGVDLVLADFFAILRRHHIVPIEALGTEFNPSEHEAVMQQPAADKPPMTVLQVLERGYKLHDRVLRPARVVVSAAPPAP